MLIICLNHIPDEFWTVWGNTNLLGKELNDVLCLGCWWLWRKDVATQGRNKCEKNKFTRIGKYITDILAFLIKSSHMAGLIYNELYVS